MPTRQWLNEITSDVRKLQREAAKRRKPNKEESIPKALREDYETENWELERELVRKLKMRKPFGHDEKLENKVWYLHYLLGYPEISQGRNFQVRIARKGAGPFYKQIDVLAKDDETVVVSECKSSEKISRRSLQKDIEEFASLKGPISNAIKMHYGSQRKLKIIWIF